MDDENGDNQGFAWVWAGATIMVMLMLLGVAAVLLGVVRNPFAG